MTFDIICMIFACCLLVYTLVNAAVTYQKARKSGILKFCTRFGKWYYLLIILFVCLWIYAAFRYGLKPLYIAFPMLLGVNALVTTGYLTSEGWYGIGDKRPRKLISKTGNHELWFYFENNYLFLHIPDTPQNRQKFRELLIRKEEVL